MNDIELKPCPFCGETPDNYISILHPDRIKVKVICRKCDIEMSDFDNSGIPFRRLCDMNKKVIDKWNNRTDSKTETWEWINDGDCLICSNCHTAYNSWFNGSNYCSVCGAQMVNKNE